MVAATYAQGRRKNRVGRPGAPLYDAAMDSPDDGDLMRLSPAPVPGGPARAAAWALVARAAATLAAAEQAPPLAALAAQAGLSPAHFQRLFSHWMGVSPKRYRQYLGGRRAGAVLRAGGDLLEAAGEAGLSGPGRLHDLMVAVAAASPGEVRSGGAGLALAWGLAATPLGTAFVASGPRGVAKLSFLEHGAGPAVPDGDPAVAAPGSPAAALAELRADWPAATLARDDAMAAALAARLFAGYRQPEPLHLFVRGTQFQLRVWEALLRIPEGEVTTYGALAAQLGDPAASRAVGGAVGANPVALLIPCHRVIRASGELGGYRWGESRKRLLLAAEFAWQEQAQ